jgi:hypothetical protein
MELRRQDELGKAGSSSAFRRVLPEKTCIAVCFVPCVPRPQLYRVNVERNIARCRNFYGLLETTEGMTTMGCSEVYRLGLGIGSARSISQSRGRRGILSNEGRLSSDRKTDTLNVYEY